ITAAPRLTDHKSAAKRVADWLSGLKSAQAAQIKALITRKTAIGTLLESLAESSPYLWELATRDPERLMRLFGADPDQHLANLLNKQGSAAASGQDEARTMQLLRQMKAEAALLIALADIGGVWPVMRTARALTDLADAAVDAATRFVL